MDQDKDFLSIQMSINNESEKGDKWSLLLLLQFKLFWASVCSLIFLSMVINYVREDVHVFFQQCFWGEKGADLLHMHKV